MAANPRLFGRVVASATSITAEPAIVVSRALYSMQSLFCIRTPAVPCLLSSKQVLNYP